MQYRIEVYRQDKNNDMPQQIHIGDIIRSKDVAETVMEKFKDTEKLMMDCGYSVFARIVLMQRYGYLSQWRSQKTSTYDNIDEEKDADCSKCKTLETDLFNGWCIGYREACRKNLLHDGKNCARFDPQEDVDGEK